MQAWEDFLKRQEALIGKEVADKWLRPLKIVHFDSGNLYLEAQDSFQVLWFEEHMRPKLASELLNNNFRKIKVHLSVVETVKSPAPSKFSKRDKGKSYPPLSFFKDKLDPTMTLGHFIPGENNRVLFKFLSELSGQTSPNPIFLWGEPGSGKTHLLMALAHAFKEQGMNPLYVRAETFTDHVVSAIRASEMHAFRKAYRHVDLLLVDDVHVFARKNATQEEFFHTFNTLHALGRPLILSSKCKPALLEEIEPRLVSRFEWGITLHLEKLVGKELKSVLERRCEGFNFPLSEEVATFLVQTFSTPQSLHRALEAMILRCHMEQEVKHKRNSQSIDLGSAKRMLADLIAEEFTGLLSPEKIIASVAAFYGMRSEDLLGKSQAQECSLPRQIAMYLCREELKLAFKGIGRLFSRDHSTVMTSVKQVEKKVEGADRETLASLSEIKKIL